MCASFYDHDLCRLMFNCLSATMQRLCRDTRAVNAVLIYV